MFSTNLSYNDQWPLIMEASRNKYGFWLRIHLTLVVYFVDFFIEGAKILYLHYVDVDDPAVPRCDAVSLIFEPSTLEERGTTRQNLPSRSRGSVIQQDSVTFQNTWVLSYTSVLDKLQRRSHKASWICWGFKNRHDRQRRYTYNLTSRRVRDTTVAVGGKKP